MRREGDAIPSGTDAAAALVRMPGRARLGSAPGPRGLLRGAAPGPAPHVRRALVRGPPGACCPGG